MDMTEAQARKAVKRVRVPWDPRVRDPRSSTNRIHSHRGLLAVLVAAFACGRVRLREVEDFSKDLGNPGRRRLGLKDLASDSTFYRVLSAQEVAGLRQTLWNQIVQLRRRGQLRNDLFPVGVIASDGKLLWSSTGSSVDGAKVSVNHRHEVITSSLMSLRFVLVSSSARPCLDFEVIGEKAGEAPALRVGLPRVVEQFGDLFSIVTGDAGLTCRDDAKLIRHHRKHYCLGVKENQVKLLRLAERKFGRSEIEVEAQTDDPASGFCVKRELRAVNLTQEEKEGLDFCGAEQLWQVRQVRHFDERILAEEVRYFVVSLPEGRLNRERELQLVRLHWGIENGHNWTMDMELLEDDIQPCQQRKEAIETVGWLRALAYNLLSTFRANAPEKDRRPLPWARCKEVLRDAWVALKYEESAAAPG